MSLEEQRNFPFTIFFFSRCNNRGTTDAQTRRRRRLEVIPPPFSPSFPPSCMCVCVCVCPSCCTSSTVKGTEMNRFTAASAGSCAELPTGQHVYVARQLSSHISSLCFLFPSSSLFYSGLVFCYLLHMFRCHQVTR